MHNLAEVIGRMTKDPELKIYEQDKKYCLFTVVDNQYKYNHQVTNFVTAVAFDKIAEEMCKYIKKGDLVFIKGYLFNRKIEIENKTIYGLSYKVEKISLLSKAKNRDEVEEFVISESIGLPGIDPAIHHEN